MHGEHALEMEQIYFNVIPSTVNQTGEWRLLTPTRQERISPCRQGCPLGGEIPAWLNAIKRDCWDEAWEIMQRKNPFPAITGQVCFHPCTAACNRRSLDEAINIPAVERALGLWKLQHYRPAAPPRRVEGNVAVVGSGPAGLSCAYYLNRAGCRVTVIEKAPVAGGLLALGIPSYRLPREILQQEMQLLQEEGIHFVLNCSVGRDLDASRLYDDYDGVFFATGASLSRVPSLPGANLNGVWSALKFLQQVNLGRSLEIESPVAVVGGGNAAIDAARSALRIKGIDRVTVLYRRAKEEMPADPEEVEAAAAEGVQFVFNAAPRELRGERGRLVEAIFSRSHTAGKKLIINKAAELGIHCKTLIFAIGQERDLSVFGQLPREVHLYAGGDLISGPATVPHAIQAGRIAAAAIAAQLQGGPGPDLAPPQSGAVTFEELHRAGWPSPAAQGRREAPSAEAERCLGCGTCNSCGLCYLFCPDLAVTVEQGRYLFDLNFCKGCGICARECPARALMMEGGW